MDHSYVADGSMFELGHTHFMIRSRELPTALLGGPLDTPRARARSPALATLDHERAAVIARMIDVARAGGTILLVGEAGSGKDTVARGVHASARTDGPFVGVPCALLGRGRHAGEDGEDVATDLAAHFERAAGGTLFLDEIEALLPGAQGALLAMLKSPRRGRLARVVSSVRSNEPRPQVPRIPADLLAELADFTMAVPPLRERREDLGTLLSDILSRAAAGRLDTLTIAPTMGRALLLHDWPYNVSELDRCLRSAIATAEDGCLHWSPPEPVYTHAPSDRPAHVMTAPSRPPEPAEEDVSTDAAAQPETDFAMNVRRALKCNLSVSGLRKNPLLRSDMVLEATGGASAPTSTVPALRRVLMASIDALNKSSPRGARQSRALQLTFIEPAPTQQEAAERLAMAFGTYRRYVTSALKELTAILWFGELSARMRRTGGGEADLPSGDVGSARLA